MTKIKSNYEEFKERVVELMKIEMDKLKGLLALMKTTGITNLQPSEIEKMVLAEGTDIKQIIVLNAYAWFKDYVTNGSKLSLMAEDKDAYDFYRIEETDELLAIPKKLPKEKGKEEMYI